MSNDNIPPPKPDSPPPPPTHHPSQQNPASAYPERPQDVSNRPRDEGNVLPPVGGMNGGSGRGGARNPSESSPRPPGSRSWDVACHLSGFLMYITGVGHIVGPLIVWLLKRHEYPSVEHHGKEALNFQLSVTLYALVLVLAVPVLGFLTCGIAMFLLVPASIILGVAHVVLMILAAIRASEGTFYRYPCIIRFIN
jgi:uncharacterized Tic20 family protein